MDEVTFTDEHNAMMALIDHLEAAYALTEQAAICEPIHVAKVEAERHLGWLLFRDARTASKEAKP